MDIVFYILTLIITGTIAGFASGLIGVGGCFIMVPVQYWLLIGDGLDSTLAIRVAFGTGLAVTLPTVTSSAIGHHRRGGCRLADCNFNGSCSDLWCGHRRNNRILVTGPDIKGIFCCTRNPDGNQDDMGCTGM